MRIEEFQDVNDADKEFICMWNDMVHTTKKKKPIITSALLLEMLKEFAVLARKAGIQRLNLLMHCWTLWSTGKIVSDNVTEVLLCYDQATDYS